MRAYILAALLAVISSSAFGQGPNNCRTSPVGASTAYCASEAFVTNSRGTIPPQTFSSLPACTSGTEGQVADVTDSTTNVYGATITGSGSNHVLAYCNGANWSVAGGGTVAAGQGITITGTATVATAAGVDTNVLATGSVITSAPTVDSTFCGKTAALGGNSFYAFMVGAASGFSANCILIVANIDGWASGRGKSMSVSGLTLTSPILYPGQLIKFRNINNSWFQEPGYQFAQAPLNQKLYVNAGGSNNNDCLATGTSNACLDLGHVIMGVIWGQLLGSGGSVTGGNATFDVRLENDASCVPTTGVSCHSGLHFSGALKQVEGFNSILVECDGGSATNCTIADSTGNCAIGLFNGGINLEVKNVTLAGGSGNNCDIEATSGQIRVEGGVVFNPTGSTGVAILQADGPMGRIVIEGASTNHIAAGTSGYLGIAQGSGTIAMDQAIWSFDGNVTFGQQTIAASNGNLTANGTTYTLNGHTVTTTSGFNICPGAGGHITLGGAAGSSVPGSNSQCGSNIDGGTWK